MSVTGRTRGESRGARRKAGAMGGAFPPRAVDRRAQGEAAPMAPEAADASHPLAVAALRVLWPAFLMAGVAEALVFAVLDPSELRWFGGEAVGLTRPAVYTVTFLIFWAVISAASAITVLLGRGSAPPQR